MQYLCKTISFFNAYLKIFHIYRNCPWNWTSRYFVYSSEIKRISTDKNNLQIVLKTTAAFSQVCFITVASFSTNTECRCTAMFVKNHEETVSLPVSGVIKLVCRHLHICIAENASRTKVFSRARMWKISPRFRLQLSGSTPTLRVSHLST